MTRCHTFFWWPTVLSLGLGRGSTVNQDFTPVTRTRQVDPTVTNFQTLGDAEENLGDHAGEAQPREQRLGCLKC